jgi:hypothetical protein
LASFLIDQGQYRWHRAIENSKAVEAIAVDATNKYLAAQTTYIDP